MPTAWVVLEKHRQLLTAKEVQVMELSVRGMSQRSIAFALGISRSSVQSRLETATRKIRQAMKEVV